MTQETTMTEEQAIKIAARSPEVKMVMDYLLTKQGPMILFRETEQVYKGFMMAYYAIHELQQIKTQE